MDTNKIDVDGLFKQYSIKEIQAIELQVKNEIEKKKEDLRIMVYNRYRDIIEAADAIHVMKNCSVQIESVLNELQTTCDTVFSGKENPEYLSQSKQRLQEKTKRNNKYMLAVIIKILQNSPSKIWYHLDNHDYLKAAKQYLIAHNAHICLETEKSLKSQENSLVYIQYANELWNSIVFLSHTIINKSRVTLISSSKSVNSNVLIDAVAAVYLLENKTSLKQIFQEFISSRTRIICRSIELDPTDSSSSIKDRIVSCLKTFVSTIYHLYDLFSPEPENKSVSFESIIADASFTIEMFKDDGVVVSKLPAYLKNIKFKDIESIKRFDTNFLVTNSTQWLSSCLIELKSKVATTFKYASNLKSLVLIRDSVIQFESSLLNGSFVSSLNWQAVCQSLFGQKIEIWQQLISPFYYSQSKFIIETLFQTTHQNLISNLQECLNDLLNDQRMSSDLDINGYLWSSDIANILNAGSASASQEKQQINFFSNQTSKFGRLNNFFSSGRSNGLNNFSAKQHTTPSIQKLCRQLDDDLAKLLSDIEFSTSTNLSNENSSSSNSESSSDLLNIANILNVDLKNFNEYLQESLLLFGNNMCTSLSDLIEKLNTGATQSNLIKEETVENRKFSINQVFDSNLNVKRILLICRLAHAIPFNCSSFKMCFINLNQQLAQQQRQQQISSQQTATSSPSSSLRKSLPPMTEQRIMNDENWIKQTNKLRNITKIGFNIWIDRLCSEFQEKYLRNLLTKNLTENVKPLALDELIAWDEIDIDEELSSNSSQIDQAESEQPIPVKNESFKSKLNVPSVCSAFIQSILYDVSQQLTKNLSYTMIDSSLILKKLILSIFELILKVYKDLLELSRNESNKSIIKLTQNQALQVLFDIKFLFNLFDLKSIHFVASNDEDNLNKLFAKVVEEYKSLCSSLETLIDPFDYDICSPFIHSNINKSLSRSNALYGIININEKNTKNSPAPNSTSSNEKFNLLVLSNNQQRFELLPLASQQAPQTMQTAQLQGQIQSLKTEESNKKSNSSKPTSSDTGSASSGIFGFKWF